MKRRTFLTVCLLMLPWLAVLAGVYKKFVFKIPAQKVAASSAMSSSRRRTWRRRSTSCGSGIRNARFWRGMRRRSHNIFGPDP